MKKSIRSILYIIPILAIAVLLSSCDSSVTDSSNDLSSSKINSTSEVEMAMSGGAAYGFFKVLSTGNPPANGIVTVTYLGEHVSTNYSSTAGPFDVAASIASAINNDDDIQLYATIPDYSKPEVRLRERRTGSQYNGNPVYITSTNGTHITINKYIVILRYGF